MTDSDRTQLDRIESLLTELLTELRARPRKAHRRRGPLPPDKPLDATLTDSVDARLIAAGYYRR